MDTSYNGIHSLEWIETNGIGGYAGSTVSGANTRRYHGLLVAATHPPVGRMVLLSKLDEEIKTDQGYYELGCNQYPGAVHPAGYTFIREFRKDLFPEWIYQLPDGTRLKKTVAAIHGSNTTILVYEILKAEKPFVMHWLPLLAGRDFHSIKRKNEVISNKYEFTDGLFRTRPYEETPELFIHIPDSGISNEQVWYHDVEYAVEQYRGLEYTEDLYTHGKIYKEVKEGDTFAVVVSDHHPEGYDGLKIFNWEKRRRERLLLGQEDRDVKRLFLAADQFIVKREIPSDGSSQPEEAATVIAGYHWFSDWGRDTMISLPGLCLSTNRYGEAAKILKAFAANVSRGMLPNRFPDYSGEEVEYNTVDATLWYFVAVYRYLIATGDKEFVLTELLPVLKEIIDWHFKGTRYNIKADGMDGLLMAGETGQQLTWMDARIGNWVVTPRSGKAVEINALWYNALVIFSDLLVLNGQEEDAGVVRLSAVKVKENFIPVFWNQDKGCLYDSADGEDKDDAIRPNQLFAISLPYPVLEDRDKMHSVLQVVKEKLYTAVGLRSLAPDHPDYKSQYGGDQYHRDGAYHQGTVWSWLLGAYVDAIMNSGKENNKQEAQAIIRRFLPHLDEGCVGQVSEIFDAEAPHHPRGCVAQAWGVAEILRVITDHQLFPGPGKDPLQEPAGHSILSNQKS